MRFDTSKNYIQHVHSKTETPETNPGEQFSTDFSFSLYCVLCFVSVFSTLEIIYRS